MELRSRKGLGKTLGNGNGQIDSGSSRSTDSSSSDSDSIVICGSSYESSSDESEMDERKDILGKNKKGKAKLGIDIDEKASTNATNLSVADHAEPSTKRNSRKNDPDAKEPHAPPVAAASSPVGMKRKKCYKKKKDNDKPILMWEIWEDENERWIDEHLTEDTNMDHQGMIVETTEAPVDLIIPLLRYQKEWLAWALKQEESPSKGGILADEMGMGKTIQAIALVLAKRDILQKTFKSGGPCSSVDIGGYKPTLVICPVVAVTQWVSEIDKFTSKGSTKVLVYHGVNREKSSKQFSGYDFVITTYSTVEAEFRKYMMPPKKKCAYCGKSFYEDKLSVHLKYFCGPDAIRTAKQSKQCRKKQKTAPLETLQETESNQSKSRGCQGADAQASCKASILHSMKWGRIILDEAHYVKDRRCNTAKAVFSLESSYKWALSGTPLQNRVGELYSLVRFLQIIPYSYYLCKDCDCRTLDYGQCQSCSHSSVRHFCWWNKYVSNPIQAYGTLELGRRAMILLKNKVLKNIVLRRTKLDRAADLALPPRIVTLRRDALDVQEEDYYQSLYNESQAEFNTYVNSGTVMNNYAHIFDLLTRLRQAVDHPYLVVYSKTAAQKGENSVDSNNVVQVCGLCHDPVEDPLVASCSHVFCKSCLHDFSVSLGQASCPTCSRLLTIDFTTNANGGDQIVKPTIKGYRSSSILNRIQLNDFQTSTKIEALREEIRSMVERDGSAKGIVFSQFTSFLDLISYSLCKSGVKCVQLVGSMTLLQRDAAIKRFIEDPDCRIFLMSLKAGGVALNLTVASHVFLMDPWWNPAVERQAQDRIHRIGQYKPIRIVRFVIKNTIEERILQLQDKKELVFEGTVGGSSEAFGKLTEADLRFLFVT